jgi:7-cyano-7-deazaguanine synthase in queuosine biosynthesis
MLTSVKTRIPLILFTGGMDSTWILQNALRTNYVDVLYVNVGQSEEIYQKEKAARENIMTFLSESEFQILEQYEVTVPNIIAEHEMEVSRAAKLIVAANSVFDPQRHGSVKIGGILNDCAITHRDRLGKLWTALSTVTKWKPVPLEFPLFGYSKREILQGLDESLVKLTTYCEASQTEPCRVCGSCRSLAKAIAEYHRQGDTVAV